MGAKRNLNSTTLKEKAASNKVSKRPVKSTKTNLDRLNHCELNADMGSATYQKKNRELSRSSTGRD